MPMGSAELCGTEAGGSKSENYCTYCFQNGRFTEPEITMQAMINKCVAVMVQTNIMPEEQARALMTKTLPALKRWRA